MIDDKAFISAITRLRSGDQYLKHREQLDDGLTSTRYIYLLLLLLHGDHCKYFNLYNIFNIMKI